MALGKTHLHLILSGFDVLEAKLQSGVSIRKFLRSYGDRANDLPTVTECIFHSVHYMTLVLTDACHVDIQGHFAALFRKYSSGRRHFYVHRLPSTVRSQLLVLRSRAKGESVITMQDWDPHTVRSVKAGIADGIMTDVLESTGLL